MSASDMDFTTSLLPKESDFLAELRRDAIANNVPLLRDATASLLRTLTVLHRPKRILEAGTAIGYSSILMSECAPDAFIETCELDPDTALKARANIERSGRADSIRVIVGDAVEIFAALQGAYDMVFVDSSKGQYINMYDDICRLTSKGSLLVCDNCMFGGRILNSPENSPHKHRTIIHRMRDFLQAVCSDNRWCASLIDDGDGVLVAVKVM